MRWRGDRMLQLEIEGIDALVEDAKKLVEVCPRSMSNALFKVAKNFNEDVNSKMPGSYSERIRKWKVESGKEGNSLYVNSTNRAPHFHLVENGHAKYDFHGNYTGGFVPGRHYAERTRQEYETKYPEFMRERMDRLLKKYKL